MADVGELKEFICQKFCEHVGLNAEELFGSNLTLAQVIERSDRMHNSVDLMEAFAKSSNALRKQYAVRVRLPALSLDTPISQVVELFVRECQPGSPA